MWILAIILGTIAFFLVMVMFITELVKVRKALEHIAYGHKTRKAAPETAKSFSPREHVASASGVPVAGNEDGSAADVESGGYHASAEHIRVIADDDDGYGPEPAGEKETPPEKEYHKTKISVVEEGE